MSFECAELDCSHIQIHKLVGREGISGPFSSTQLVCPSQAPSAQHVEDTSGVSLSFAVDGVPQRRVCGRVSRIRRIFDSSEEYDVYDVRIVPHHWALTLCRFQEIYLYMSVVEIIEAKLKASGMGTKDVDYEMRLDRNKYPMREFVLQYNETDYHLPAMQHVGISFLNTDDSTPKRQEAQLGSMTWSTVSRNWCSSTTLLFSHHQWQRQGSLPPDRA